MRGHIGVVRVGQGAEGLLQNESILRIAPLESVNRFWSRLGLFDLLLRELLPGLQSALHHLEHDFRVVRVHRGQEFAFTRAHVDALLRPRTRTVVAKARHQLEGNRFRIAASCGSPLIAVVPSLESPHFIRCQDELTRELDHIFVRPDRPSADDSVVSSAAEWVPVHRPQ